MSNDARSFPEEENPAPEEVNLYPDDARLDEINRREQGLRELGKRLMISYPLALLVGYPVIFLLSLLLLAFGLKDVLNGDLGYALNFIFNDVFVRGSMILLCFFMLRRFCSVKYTDKTTGFKPYELLFWFPVMMMTGIFGSQITNLISSVVQLLCGSGEIKEALQDIKPEGPLMFVCYLLFVGITGPILEEILFRGILLCSLRPYGDMFAIIVTSALFGLYHLNFSQLLYTAFLGIILAAVAVRGNSLVPPIILHCANNLMVTFVRYSEIAMSGNEVPTMADSILTAINSGIDIFLTLLPILAFIGLLTLTLLDKQRIGDALAELTIRKRISILLCNKATIVCVFIVTALIVYDNI